MARFFRLPGLTPYAIAHALQRTLLQARIEDRIEDVILLLEHEETITVGRARDAADNVLDAGGVPVVAVERGGDVTWHGPGQLVAYPIIALQGERRDLHRHLHALEQAVMDLLGGLGLAATRDPRNTGVWLPEPGAPPRKVCSVGIACRRWVTWHGLALNVAPELSAFARINPCGFDAGIMTRLADRLSPAPSLDALVEPLAGALAASLEVERAPAETIAAEQVPAHLGIALSETRRKP